MLTISPPPHPTHTPTHKNTTAGETYQAHGTCADANQIVCHGANAGVCIVKPAIIRRHMIAGLGGSHEVLWPLALGPDTVLTGMLES